MYLSADYEREKNNRVNTITLIFNKKLEKSVGPALTTTFVKLVKPGGGEETPSVFNSEDQFYESAPVVFD